MPRRSRASSRNPALPSNSTMMLIALVAALDFAHPAGKHGLAVIDEADGVAELLDLIHAMRGEENRLALVFEFDEGAAREASALTGSRPLKGSSITIRPGSWSDGADELDLLLHALGELFGLLAGRSSMSMRLAQSMARLAGLAGGRGRAVRRRRRAARVPSSSCRGRVPRADSRRASRLSRSKGLPKRAMRPESGMVMPIIMRMELVLPAPLGPSRPNIWPASMERLRLRTATLLS